MVWLYYYYTAATIFILMLIPGCSGMNFRNTQKGKQPIERAELKTNIDIAAQANTQSNQMIELEAHLTDIPSIIGSVIIETESAQLAEDQIMVAWVCPHEHETISEFFQQEMERLGWKKIAAIVGPETTLLFSKPKKICDISIRTLASPYTYKSLIHIATSSKK